MKNDKETRQKLQAYAKQEFLEKGYMQASLRNICKNAGVTTGALYFSFKDKEDLFASLIEDTIMELFELVNGHFKSEIEGMNDSSIIEGVISGTHDYSDDVEFTRMIIHFMYSHYDEMFLLLTKSQGSRFEKVVDEFVKISEQHYKTLAYGIAKEANSKSVDDFTIHWLAHMNIDLFVHLISHGHTEEEALASAEVIIKFFITGWCSMFK